jgi:hypothetical protein
VSLSEFIERLSRWPWSLIPRRVDDDALLVSDVIAGVQFVALAFCLMEGPWVIFAGPIFMIALFFQVLISSGIFAVKFLAARPSVGHFAMFATPSPIHDVSWPRAMRGFLLSMGVVAVWVVVSYASR